MKTSASLSLLWILTAGGLYANDSAPKSDVHIPAQTKTVWLEPKVGAFQPVITSGSQQGSFTYTVNSRLGGDTLAIYATDGSAVESKAPPIARYAIGGLKPGASEKVEVTLSLNHGMLETTAKDAHGKELALTKLDRSMIAKASLPAAKPTPGATEKPAAIASGPGSSAAEKSSKGLKASVGLRSGNGSFVPFLRAGAEPGATATVVKNPRFSGQKTADIVVYQGESPYVESDKQVAHYLISGLSTNPKAKFEFQFAVEASGKVKLASATDTATKQALTIHPYSDAEVARLKESFGETPAPVAARER